MGVGEKKKGKEKKRNIYIYIYLPRSIFSPGRLPDVRGFSGAKSGVRDILDGGHRVP